MDWKTCINEGNAIKITPNKQRALFLVKRAEKTLAVMGKIKLDNENSSIFFTNYYDALLEMLHAIMYSNGYKVKNHYCLGYYLRDVIKDAEAFRIFDRARIIRNSVLYYGENLDINAADEIIEQIISIFHKLKEKV